MSMQHLRMTIDTLFGSTNEAEIPMNTIRMANAIRPILAGLLILGSSVISAQVRTTKDQMMFYTADWKGDRYPDGRPKLPDELLKRAVDVGPSRISGTSSTGKVIEISLRLDGKPSTSKNRLPDVR